MPADRQTNRHWDTRWSHLPGRTNNVHSLCIYSHFLYIFWNNIFIGLHWPGYSPFVFIIIYWIRTMCSTEHIKTHKTIKEPKLLETYIVKHYNWTFCTKHDHTASLIVDTPSLSSLSPYFRPTARLSISYFTIGTRIKVCNTILYYYIYVPACL